jgi:hypothetical protein
MPSPNEIADQLRNVIVELDKAGAYDVHALVICNLYKFTEQLARELARMDAVVADRGSIEAVLARAFQGQVPAQPSVNYPSERPITEPQDEMGQYSTGNGEITALSS